jgi:hypothetical protein
MDCPDYEQTRKLLLSTGDAEVAGLIRVLDAVFRSDKWRPLATSLSDERDLLAGVALHFPTPFARKVAGWVDAEAEFQEALGRAGDPTASDSLRDRAEQASSRRFRDAFLEMWSCWLQIVHFMPFILMAALRRLDDEVLKQSAAKELSMALYHYKTFYEKYDNERRREADQLHLMIFLCRLYRRLLTDGKLGADFVFAPLVSDQPGQRRDLVPERLDAAMRLILQVRNRIIHGRVENHPALITSEINRLVRWCFLDIIAALSPIGRTFSLTYVRQLTLTGRLAEVEALDFSGAEGPREVLYRLDATPQADDEAFVDHRLYFIARSRQLGQGEGVAAPLQPRDYLDLTPFLIPERLRSGPLEAGERRRMVFALQQYLEPLEKLLFSELGGTAQQTLQADPQDIEARLLLEKIDRFKSRARQLTAQITIKEGRHAHLGTVRSQLWLIARGHLAGLMNVQALGAEGDAVPPPAASSLRQVYDPHLYVDPPAGRLIEDFLKSSQRALLLVGGSGFGKSNLLIRHFLDRQRRGGLGVFLAARQFDLPSFRADLTARLTSQIASDWQSLGDLDDFLDETSETLAIFIDAINEFSGPGGPLSLLADMVQAIGSEAALRRCKIIVTCRSETWLRYTQQYGSSQALDPAIFMAPEGQPIRVTGFEDHELRRALYARYQAQYALLPEFYDDLSPTVQVLIAQPFMTALIAETYANKPGANKPSEATRQIPRDLDYYSLFVRLTSRKLSDAQILLPASDIVGRERLPDEIETFCGLLAEMIYRRLTSDDPILASASNRDALPSDAIDKNAELQPYIRGAGPISVLEIVLQLGLLDHITTSRRNAAGRLVSSGAFIFFHDQYTQYWLAQAYQRGILGWLDAAALADPPHLDKLTKAIDEIVARSTQAPILAGALDHWFRLNLEHFHDGQFAAMVPLLDRLAAHDSPALHYCLLGLVNNLTLHRYLAPAEIYVPVFRHGSDKLRAILVDSFVAFWPALPPAAVRDFIDACDPDRDAETLNRLGDIFALHLRQRADLVVAYLGEAISPLTLASIGEPRRIWRQFKFSLQFAIFAAMSNFDQPVRLAAIRSFFRAKYRFPIDLLSDQNDGFVLTRLARRSFRDFLFARFEAFGVEQWQKFIVSMGESGNDRFFVTHLGVNQHDILRAFLPYVIELHNGELARLSLAPDAPFRALMLQMLDYRPTSIIGYNATLCLPSVLMRADWSVSEDLVMELIARRTPSALFHGNLILANLSYSDPRLALLALKLMRERIVPLLLAENLAWDWSIIFCIATLDTEAMWPDLEAILTRIFDHFDASGENEAVTSFVDALYKVCYCHDIALGRHVIAFLIADRGRYLGQRWRKCTLQVFAAMLARSPKTLRQIFAAENVEEALLRAARGEQSDEIIKQSRLFPFQVDLNRFIAWLYVAEPRLRRVVVKDFIGSLAIGNSVEDFAAGVRQTLVAFIEYFFGKHPDAMPAGPLDEKEIEASVTANRARRKS